MLAVDYKLFTRPDRGVLANGLGHGILTRDATTSCTGRALIYTTPKWALISSPYSAEVYE